MLYSFDSNQYITDIPHRREFDIWRSRLTDEQFDAIRTGLLGAD